jgi:hypothetical protein
MIQFEELWQHYQPELICGEKQHPHKSWRVFKNITLPALGLNPEPCQILFPVDFSRDTQELANHLECLTETLLACFSEKSIPGPRMVIPISFFHLEKTIDLIRRLPLLRAYVPSGACDELTTDEIVHENAKRRLVQQLATQGLPTLTRPFDTFATMMEKHLASDVARDRMYRKIISLIFHRLNWETGQQRTIRDDTEVKVALLLRFYEAKDQRLVHFIKRLRSYLPHPFPVYNAERLIDIFIRNSLATHETPHFQQIILGFLQGTMPLPIGEGRELFPPRHTTSIIQAMLDLFLVPKIPEEPVLSELLVCTERLARNIPFMSNFLDTQERLSNNPIPIGHLGMPDRWRQSRKILSAQVPMAIEGLLFTLLIKDYIRL